MPATGSAAEAITTEAEKASSGNSTSTPIATRAGCSTSFDTESQAATCTRSADLLASEAPMANSAPGVAAPPRMVRKSFIGPGTGSASADHSMPSTIDTIIGLRTSPIPISRSVDSFSRPSRPPLISITISDENTTRSVVSTSITGPIAASPNSIASIGKPRNPTLPITPHCASIAAVGTSSPRRKAMAVTMP